MDPKVDRQTVVDRGWAARRLLDSPDFVLVLNSISNTLTLDMAATRVGPAGREEREELHAQLHALKLIVDATKQFHIALRNLEALESVEHEPDGEQEEY